jgi:hypothetical protein
MKSHILRLHIFNFPPTTQNKTKTIKKIAPLAARAIFENSNFEKKSKVFLLQITSSQMMF